MRTITCGFKLNVPVADVAAAASYLHSQSKKVTQSFKRWLKENRNNISPDIVDSVYPLMAGKDSVLFNFNITDENLSVYGYLRSFIYDISTEDYDNFFSDFCASVVFDVKVSRIYDCKESAKRSGTLLDSILSGVPVREAIENNSNNTYNFTYAVTGYYSTYARTNEEAKYNLLDEDFGDLYDFNYTLESSEDTMDGYRNDQVHVTFEVTGLLDITVEAESEESAESKANEEIKNIDIGELEDVEYRLTYERK
jgi:hypothetical protein